MYKLCFFKGILLFNLQPNTMQAKHPFTLPLNAPAPNFRLKGTDEKIYSLNDFADATALVIFFSCNHCPYVIGSDEVTRATADKFKPQGARFVAINSNCALAYPEDSFEKMKERMRENQFPWTYLHDETQKIAYEYGALRTPHFFVFNKERRLIYTGRGIDAPRDASKMTVNNLENALIEYFAGKPVTTPLTNPIGCNVKWKGKEKHWMPPEACDLV